MQTTLVGTDLGPITLLAPSDSPRHVKAAHGHLWQWVGDGEELVSLSVAVRSTRLGTATGVRHHLSWEVEQVRATLAAGPEEHRVVDVMVQVDGAAGAAAADVDGRLRELDVHNRLIVTTDAAHMHVVRILVPDNHAGRELSEAVTSGLRVEPWRMPA